MLLRKKHVQGINQRYVNRRNLLIFLAADGGWPPAANFTLVNKYGIKNMFDFRDLCDLLVE